MLKIGRMSKVWAGLPQPDQALAHTYGISFPRDMDVREKALMLAALFTVVSGTPCLSAALLLGKSHSQLFLGESISAGNFYSGEII